MNVSSSGGFSGASPQVFTGPLSANNLESVTDVSPVFKLGRTLMGTLPRVSVEAVPIWSIQ